MKGGIFAELIHWVEDALSSAVADAVIVRSQVASNGVYTSVGNYPHEEALAMIGAPSRMSRLPIARRVAYLEALEASRVGLFTMIAVAFKVPLVLAAFEAPEELAAIGYDRGDIFAKRLPIVRRDGAPRAEDAS